MKFSTQLDVENYMAGRGRKKASDMMQMNELGGRVEMNAYSSIIFRRFTKEMIRLLENDIEENKHKPGPSKAHVHLLRALDLESIAYITVRTALTELMRSDMLQNKFTNLCSTIGRNLEAETLIRQLQDVSNEDWFYIDRELNRRSSLDVNHRYRTVKARLDSLGVEKISFGQENKVKIGAYLLTHLATLGLVDVFTIHKNKRNTKIVELSSESIELIVEMRELVEESMPFMLPCIEPPKDWVSVFDGGFHTDEVRKNIGPAIMNGDPAESDVAAVLTAINAIQKTPWRVNTRILDTVKQMVGTVEFGEIVKLNTLEKPEKLDFMDLPKAEWTQEQVDAFKKWKKQCVVAYASSKLNRQAYMRMNTSVMIAEMMKDYPLFFVQQADFRGRFYSCSIGINPQGSDLQRALLEFDKAKPLKSKEAVEWFKIHGANKYGVDKVSLQDRVKWVDEHKDVLVAIAENPLDYLDFWTKADKPLQFLAWCFEYADFCVMGRLFVSRLPISMDGSCNGLQQFSALLRDEVGGLATNLIPSKLPQDIYAMVGKVVERLLGEMQDDANGFRSKWLAHGVNRKVVKRSVMTLPYGSTRFSCAEFILEDYMKVYYPKEFTTDEYGPASTFLSYVVWKAIAEVVIKAREGMDWLRECADVLIKGGEKFIDWRTPSGFVVRQTYNKPGKTSSVQVFVFASKAKLVLNKEGNIPCKRQNMNGIAPNFIHSLDACHMQRVAIRASNLGMSIAMIHDDFGCHADDAVEFGKIIREEFVNMYQDHEPLHQFFQHYTDLGYVLPPPPGAGKLNLDLVKQSPYFFA